MAQASASRALINAAIDKLRRNDFPVTPKSIKANVDLATLSLGDATTALEKHVYAQIPAVMRERGFVLTDATTGERKPFWDATVSELEEQLRVKEESSTYDRNRIRADKAVITFLKDQSKDFGYEVYPGLFQADIDRIYSMHGLDAPKRLKAAA